MRLKEILFAEPQIFLTDSYRRHAYIISLEGIYDAKMILQNNSRDSDLAIPDKIIGEN